MALIGWAIDLHLDSDALQEAQSNMRKSSEEMTALRNNLDSSFAQLKADWDSDAGKKFFEVFEEELIKNLEDYSKVFEHMSVNLNAASQKYEEVFSAADTVAQAQF